MKSRTKTKLVLVFVSLILAASAIAAQQAGETPEVLLERAIQIETVDGDLSAAIDLYKKIEADSTSSRAVVARALLHMGECYEKQGRDEARKTYQRLLDECPQQLAEVKLARERLAALAQQAGDKKSQFRQVMLNDALPHIGGKLSPNGEKFAFVSGGSLWIAPINPNEKTMHTETPIRLTEPMNAWDIGGESIAWSGDSKWIAFRTMKPDTNGDPTFIYLISSSGGKPRLVATNEGRIYWRRNSIALSPRGDKVYFPDGEDPQTGLFETRIFETTIGSNQRRPLTGIYTEQPAISPDGAWIAYIKTFGTRGISRQVWAMPISGGEPSLVCEALPRGAFHSPIWSPDGSKIAFLARSPDSDVIESNEIWIVPMGPDGHPSGAPTQFPLRKRTNEPIAGWTEQDHIGLLFGGPHNEGLYVVPAEGGQATPINDYWSTYPNWSPDGKTLYFRADSDDAYWGIFRIPSSGGNRTELTFQGVDLGIPIPGGGPALSPDGSRLCFTGVRRDDGAKKVYPRALYIVDSGGGEPVPLMEPIPGGGRAPTWSPNGQEIAFIKQGNLDVISAGGGTPRQISTAEDRVAGNSIDWSPDGELIAYFGQDSTLRVIPAAGGLSRVLASNLGPVDNNGLAWSPDGQEIAFTTGGRIWRIARGGGEPSEIRIPLRGFLGQIDWSPEGNRLVFNFDSGEKTELWLMENFQLPE